MLATFANPNERFGQRPLGESSAAVAAATPPILFSGSFLLRIK